MLNSLRTFRSDFVKFGSKISFIIFGRKMVFCCFVSILVFNFDLKKIEALIKLRKMLSGKKLFDVRLGSCLIPRVLIFCRFLVFKKMQLT